MKTHMLKLSPKEFCAATNACNEGAGFAGAFPTMSAVWDACPRVDWLIWILDVVHAERDEKAERIFAVWCARNTPLPDGRVTGDLLTDPRSLAALVVAERFANGNATEEELTADRTSARAAARAAAWAASRAAAADASRAAAAAAWDAADAAADAAAWAADAADADAAGAAGAAQCTEYRRVIKNPFSQP